MNLEIRAMIAGKGLRCWQVAKKLGMHEASLSRLLRDTLSPERKAQIIEAIEKLSKEAANHG